MRRGALLISVVLIALSWYFWSSSLLFPVRLFVVLLHELGHGTAAVLTGGEIVRIELLYGEGGLTLTRGGNAFLILNAGYLGSLLFGILIVASSRRPSTASPALAFIALATAVLTALYLRPLLGFSFLYGLGASAVLSAVAMRARPQHQAFLLRFLGLFSCMYALFDIRDDILHLDGGRGISDATMLAEMTHIPAILWGIGWLAASMLLLFVLRRHLFS